MNKCEYDNGGFCTAPIPVNCSDKCIIRKLKEEIIDLAKEYLLVVAQNKAIKEQNNQLLREISLIN